MINLLIKDFLKKYWWRYSIGILFLIVVDIIQIYIPKQIGNIIDVLEIPNFQMNDIKKLILGIIFLAFGLVIGRFLWRIFIIGAARLFQFKTINKMFDHIIELDQNFYDKWRTGDLMTRFTSDTNQIERLMGPAVIMLVDTLFMSIFTIIAMGNFVNWKLTFLAIIPLPLIAIISLFFGKVIHKKFTQLQEDTSELSNITEESVAGVDVIKLYSNKKTMEDIFNKRSKRYYDSYISLIRIWGLMFPLVMLLGAMATLFVFFFGGKMVIMNDITLGQFIMTNQYVGMLIWPMMAFGFLINNIQRGRASLKRINNVLEQKSLINEPEMKQMEFTGNYQIKDLNFNYPENERKVLKNINMNIKQGDMIAFVGRVGSGKSTVAKLMAKIYPVDKGKIIIDDKDINDINGKSIRDHVSYVPQDNFLFSMTIRENISFSNKKLEPKAENYAKMASVHGDILNIENGYETVVGERGVTLSGGQRQRVSIARALAKKSEIIILDDCLSAVDTETEEAIIKNLRKEIKNKTIIVISHRLKAVKDSDKIYVFEDGQIIEEGNHNQLMDKKSVYHSMYMKQLIEDKLGEEYNG
ncbi:ABC transporter ATP-binding protein/permease [Oceanotoga sp. DSM 15011]|uniref:ABC transporter ATP-binding protein n=1 Tax=Oceanotoga sp. DSM 15011 TaxID=2984951 RepID=UPI0021F4C186|nr:ABC transporter ATP-binding protein [Oceanotoga sp. DSM 15011]UYP00076.1 ABC transporter ATP-binding protein/permease [Oceanotoga sp. DSM 15011]